MFNVQEVRSRRDLRAFIALPYRLYRHDPNYVPPLRSQMRDILAGPNNMLFAHGPHLLLICRKGRRVAGRILVGIDENYNQENSYRSAWFSLFECEPDYSAAAALLRAAEVWAKSQGATVLRGPVSPDNGDSFKGVLVMGFDGPPALMNSYNPPWYGEFFDRYGLKKSEDLYAYRLEAASFIENNPEKVIRYAMDRFGYRIDPIDLKNLDHDLRDIQQILQITIPAFEGERMAVPSLADVQKLANSILPIADPELICIARTAAANQPIGFVLALPDYSQVFRHLRQGRLFPFGLLQMLYYRRKINAVRVFAQFVVPEYQKKAVNNAMFYHLYRAALAKGMASGDGSTIGETNKPSRLSVEKIGGRHYRTYRLYKKPIGIKESKVAGTGSEEAGSAEAGQL